MIGIYKITNPKGKIYIGQSINIERRKIQYKNLSDGVKKQPKIYNSFQKYGFDKHIFEIIEECSIDKLDERELYWGEYYDVLGKNGLACRLGKGRGKLSIELKLQISLKHKGMKKPWAGKNMRLTDEHKEKLKQSRHQNFNPLYQYDLEGNFIKEWLNPKQASISLKISNGGLFNIIDTNNTLHGFRFTKIKKENINPTTKWEKHKKPITEYDLNNNLIKEWSCAKEASNSLNIAIQHITACCRGERKKTFNRKFTYKK
jgi:group I intron endonuclease